VFVQVAAAEPSSDELDAHAKELRAKLKGQGYTVVVEPPFVVIGDGPAKEVQHLATGFLRSNLPNWRLPELKREIRVDTLPALSKLLHTTSDKFYSAKWDAYAQARYLVYYLQEHGLLRDFYGKFLVDTNDRSGQGALEAVLGENLAAFDPTWRRWVLAIEGDNR
jgi:hypothetical protein